MTLDFFSRPYIAKLKITNGDVLAQNRFNGVSNLNDMASNMVVTSTGDIYVAGQTGVNGNAGISYKYALTKWNEKTIYTPKPTDGYSGSGGYITNNKQLRNEDGTGNATVKYYNQNHRVATYIDDTKICYQLLQAMASTNQDTTFRVDMNFTKGTTNAKVYPFAERKEISQLLFGPNELWQRTRKPPKIGPNEKLKSVCSLWFDNSCINPSGWNSALSYENLCTFPRSNSLKKFHFQTP